MPSSVRQIAVDMLCRIETGAHADRLLESDPRVRTLSAQDSGLLRELVRGVTAWRDHLDVLIAPYLRRPIEKTSADLRNVLRMGTYQLRFLDRVPGYAAVSESVDIARRSSGKAPSRMVNAVLRGISENRRPAKFPSAEANPAAHLAATLSHPEWLVKRWIQRLGIKETQQLCKANNRTVPIGLRVNPSAGSPQSLAEELQAAGVEAGIPKWPAGYLTIRRSGPLFHTEAYRRGAFSIQGHGAGLAVEMLAAQPGDRILDVCGAPGGKTVVAAQALSRKGIVVSIDIQTGRLRRSQENLRRLGLERVFLLAADGSRLPLRSEFDRVMVDAPCSGTGILSRHPEIRWNRQPRDLEALPELQLRLLEEAATAVKRGGVLLYSTCSLEPEENESVVERFIDRNDSAFELDPIGEDAAWRLPSEKSTAFLQTFPHRHGCDGAFAARMRKR